MIFMICVWIRKIFMIIMESHDFVKPMNSMNDLIFNNDESWLQIASVQSLDPSLFEKEENTEQINIKKETETIITEE